MNAYLPLNTIELWHIAGWTMVHFLWLGALLGAAAAVCRLFLRRSPANVRYAFMLAWLIALAALPIGIAAWLCKNSPPLQTTAREALITPAKHANVIELNNPKISDPTHGEPASAGGIATAAPVRDREPATESPTKLPTNSNATPAPAPQSIATTLESCIPYLPWLWIIGTPLTLALLLTGVVGTKRLGRASRPITDGPIAELLAHLITSLRIGKRVTVAVCERIAAPVLIGIVRPIILLPPAALTGWSPDEIEMVLLHELAHVRRWDNLINLLQRIVESLLFFHPAVWLISTWVRRERESCCDAVVVTRTNRPHAYAEMLVALAAQLSELSEPSEPGRPRPRPFPRPFLRGRGRSGSLTVYSAMAAGPLRSRIRRILQLEDDPMLVSGKSFVLMLGSLLLAATLAVLYVPTIGQADQSATEATESTEEKRDDKSSPARADSIVDGTQAKRGDASGTSDDSWLNDPNFVTPRDQRISRKAWGMLGLKLVPAMPPELNDAYNVGYRGGLKELSVHMPSLGNGPTILVALNNQQVAGFDTLDEVLAKISQENKREVVATFRFGETALQRSLVVKPVAGGERTVRETTLATRPRAYDFVSTPGADPAIVTSFGQERNETQNKVVQERTSKRFPTLEDQKLADLAWKRLGLELEPIGSDDLKRVKALGYDGGVKVAAGTTGFPAQGEEPIKPADIFVGLHVWPTTTMKDVAQILGRDDLSELNPLKYYVVRQETVDDPKSPDNGTTKDVVRTGRVTVYIGGFGGGGRRSSSNIPTGMGLQPKPKSNAAAGDPYESTAIKPPLGRELGAERRPVVAESATPDTTHTTPAKNPFVATTAPVATSIDGQSGKSNLRYDGKSFDEWRNTWKTELSTEKRMVAVKALAAFGRAGYGKEATEAIFDVAGEYDFHVLEGNEAPEGKLKEIVLSELAPEYRTQTLAPYWVVGLSERIGKDPKKWKWLAYWLLSKLQTDDADTIGALQSLAASGDAELRGAALGALIRSSKAAPQLDDKTRKLIDEALQSKDPAVVRLTLFSLVYAAPGAGGGGSQPQLLYRPVMFPMLLFHADEDVRRQTRTILRYIDEKDAPQVVDQLLAVLKDKSRERDHIEAIRGLAALGGKAAKASPELINIVKSSDDQATLDAVIVALVHCADKQPVHANGSVQRQFNVDVLDEVIGKRLSDEERLALSKKIGRTTEENARKLIERLTHEDDSIPPTNNPNLGGGGFF